MKVMVMVLNKMMKKTAHMITTTMLMTTRTTTNTKTLKKVELIHNNKFHNIIYLDFCNFFGFVPTIQTP